MSLLDAVGEGWLPSEDGRGVIHEATSVRLVVAEGNVRAFANGLIAEAETAQAALDELAVQFATRAAVVIDFVAEQRKREPVAESAS